MKRHLIWITVVCVCLANTGFAFSAAGQVYEKAVKFARTGHEHFAFMQYNTLLRNYPTSKYRERALFATGEYYFRISGFREATTSFKTLLEEFPESSEKVYALAYLLNIARKDKNDMSVEYLEKEIINLQQVSFVFRESKEITYRSPLYQSYKMVIHIDKIEFYVEGELFAKVSY